MKKEIAFPIIIITLIISLSIENIKEHSEMFEGIIEYGIEIKKQNIELKEKIDSIYEILRRRP